VPNRRNIPEPIWHVSGTPRHINATEAAKPQVRALPHRLERSLHTAEVGGSSPLAPTRLATPLARLESRFSRRRPGRIDDPAASVYPAHRRILLHRYGTKSYHAHGNVDPPALDLAPRSRCDNSWPRLRPTQRPTAAARRPSPRKDPPGPARTRQDPRGPARTRQARSRPIYFPRPPAAP
jgi:hypothetical protein